MYFVLLSVYFCQPSKLLNWNKVLKIAKLKYVSVHACTFGI